MERMMALYSMPFTLREGCYTYIKEIVGGNSIIVLADEEQEALNMAKEANMPAEK